LLLNNFQYLSKKPKTYSFGLKNRILKLNSEKI